MRHDPRRRKGRGREAHHVRDGGQGLSRQLSSLVDCAARHRVLRLLTDHVGPVLGPLRSMPSTPHWYSGSSSRSGKPRRRPRPARVRDRERARLRADQGLAPHCRGRTMPSRHSRRGCARSIASRRVASSTSSSPRGPGPHVVGAVVERGVAECAIAVREDEVAVGLAPLPLDESSAACRAPCCRSATSYDARRTRRSEVTTGA